MELHRSGGDSANDLLKNLDLRRLRQPACPRMRALLARRESAGETLRQQTVFVARCVKSALGKTKTTRTFRVMVVGGAGLLGAGVVRAILAAGVVPPEDLVLCTRARARRAPGAPCGVPVRADLAAAFAEFTPRLVLVACAQTQLEAVAAQLRPLLRPTVVLCSLVAGSPVARLGQLFGVDHPVRTVCGQLGAPETDFDPAVHYAPPALSQEQQEQQRQQRLDPAVELFHARTEPVLANLARSLARQGTALGVDAVCAERVARHVVLGVAEGDEGDGVAQNEASFVQHFHKVVASEVLFL